MDWVLSGGRGGLRGGGGVFDLFFMQFIVDTFLIQDPGNSLSLRDSTIIQVSDLKPTLTVCLSNCVYVRFTDTPAQVSDQ